MMFFVYILIAIAVLGLLTGLSHLYQARKLQKRVEAGEIRLEDLPPEVNPIDMECCGQHEVCEKESLLAAISKATEYYDDEELDRFRGRGADEYTEEETEEFRNVLYTTLRREVGDWLRSLQLRGIELPEALRDEAVLLMNFEGAE